MPLQRVIFNLAKCLLFALVAWAIVVACRQAQDEMRTLGFRWRDLHSGWLLVAGVLYAVAQIVLGLFWQRILQSMDQSPGAYEAVRAYFIGHLGKYIPGKMFVVVMRTALVRSPRVAMVSAGASVFVETLMYMAVGAALAAVVLILRGNGPWQMQLAALSVAITVLIVTWPPVLVRLGRAVRLLRGGAFPPTSMPEFDLRTWFVGWLFCIIAWGLCAGSLWATLQAIPMVQQNEFSVATLGRLLAAVATAVVAGFLSFLPGGGLGVREWVLDQLLTPEYGATAAILSAILLRAVWLMTEVVGSVILYLVKPESSQIENNYSESL